MWGLYMKRYALLDALRGLAILWIVCFHVLDDMREQYGIILNYIINHGYLGVSVFFVISGYGIATATHNNASLQPVSAPTFLWRRLKRIYSTYWWHLLFGALIIPTAAASVSTFKTHTFSLTLYTYSFWEWFQLITLSRVFSASSWSLNLPFLPLNGAIWYLAIIVQIYITVAICMSFNKQFLTLLFSIFLASLLSLFPRINSSLPYGLFLPYFCQFYIGIIVYHLLHKGLAPTSRIVTLSILVFLLCINSYCAIKDNHLLPLSFASTVGYIVLILHKYDFALSNLIVVRVFLVIGTFSYSLYLLHPPLTPFIGMFVRNLVPFSSGLTGPLVLIPSIILTSFVWYLFFERPHTLLDVIFALTNPIKTISSGKDFIQSLRHREDAWHTIDCDFSLIDVYMQ